VETVLVGSEFVYAKCKNRKDADATVAKWGAATARRLKVSLGGERPLTEKRTDLRWNARWRDDPMRLTLDYARQKDRLQWWCDKYRRWIENFDDRLVY
jgi:hypothetical protein